MKIELGGGRTPRGQGYLNLDTVPSADIVCDLESSTWPLETDSVEDCYSSHFLEHISDPKHILHEIVRVCRLEALVEIRVPYWLDSMALCSSHKRTISPKQIEHWCKDFVQDWFGGYKKRLQHLRTEYIPGDSFGEAKDLFGWMTDEQIMRFIPNACHEVRYYFKVIVNE